MLNEVKLRLEEGEVEVGGKVDVFQIFEMLEWMCDMYENDKEFLEDNKVLFKIENLLVCRCSDDDFSLMWPDIKYFWHARKYHDFC